MGGKDRVKEMGYQRFGAAIKSGNAHWVFFIQILDALVKKKTFKRTDCKSRVTVHSLNDLHALIQYDPVGVDLSLAFWVQHHSLISSEIRQHDLRVLGACVDPVDDLVLVKVSPAGIAHAFIYPTQKGTERLCVNATEQHCVV